MHVGSSLGGTVHGDVGGLPVSTAMLHWTRMAVLLTDDAPASDQKVIGNTIMVIDHFLVNGLPV
jgi:hypothetical protein